MAEKRKKKSLAEIKADKLEKMKALRDEIKALEREEEEKRFNGILKNFKKLKKEQQEEFEKMILETLEDNKNSKKEENK